MCQYTYALDSFFTGIYHQSQLSDELYTTEQNWDRPTFRCTNFLWQRLLQSHLFMCQILHLHRCFESKWLLRDFYVLEYAEISLERKGE